jgi:hypothetical protein
MTSDELSTFAKEVNGEASIGSTFLFQLTKFCKRLSNSAVEGWCFATVRSGCTLFLRHARFSASWLMKKRGVDCDERGESERRYAPAHAERQRTKVELGVALFVDYSKVRQKREVCRCQEQQVRTHPTVGKSTLTRSTWLELAIAEVRANVGVEAHEFANWFANAAGTEGWRAA